MRNSRHALFCFAALACLSVGAAPKPATAPATAPARSPLVGVWEFAARDENGTGRRMPYGTRAVITADTITVTEPRGRGGAVVTRYAYRIDPTTDPKQIDWTSERMPGKPLAQAGIYEFDVRTLTLRICIAAPDRPRPTKFSAKEGEFTSVWLLRKLKGDGNGKGG